MNKLTIITPYFPSEANPSNGIFVYDQAAELSKSYDSICVIVVKPLVKLSRSFPFVQFSPQSLRFKKFESSKINVVKALYLPFPKDSVLYHFSIFASLKLLFRYFERKILIHTSYPIAAAVSCFSELDYTVCIHGTDLRYFVKNAKQKAALYSGLRKAKNVICVSQGLKEELDSLAISHERIHVIPNGINPSSQFLPDRIDANGVFNFVFVGSLIKQKGVYELIDAFAQLSSELPDDKVKLTFIGDGTEFKHLLRISRKRSLNIDFLGSVSNEEVMRFLPGQDALVLPSYKEGFGRVLIEMLFSGRPVISTYSGGPEYIVKKSVGLLCQPKSANALYEAMSNLMARYSEYSPESIRKYAEDNFLLKAQTKKIVETL